MPNPEDFMWLNLRPAEPNDEETFYGLENSSNQGIDWFSTENEAKEAKSRHAKAYGHNREILIKTWAEIGAKDL